MSESAPGSALSTIQNRLIIAFLTVTIIPVVVLSIYSAHTHLRVLERMAYDRAADQAAARARQIQEILNAGRGDLHYLSQLPSLDAFITASEGADQDGVDFAREKLLQQFHTFAASRPHYPRVSYFNSRGELVASASSQGQEFTPRPGSERAAEEWLPDADRLLAGQAMTRYGWAFSAKTPAVQLIAKLASRGVTRRGFVVLEVTPAAFDEPNPAHPTFASALLLDDRGESIRGFPVPRDLVHQARDRLGEPFHTDQGEIATALPITLGRGDAGRTWTFLATQPASEVFAALGHYRMVFSLVLLGALALAAGISVLLARQFTVPLKRLYTAAREIGRGRFDAELDDHTGDEIGGLARELRAMADQLKVRHDDMRQQLDDKTRELLQAERLSTIGTMSAAIAHEVNNPLGIISMYSELLGEQTPPDDPRAEKLRVIAREAARMSVLVRGLLQFARRPEPQFAPVDVVAVARDALSAVEALRSGGGITFRLEAPERLTITADGDQIQQVLRNLIMNGCQAMGDGGTLEVSIAAEGNGDVRISVRDTGRGIPAEYLPRLFEPFFSTRRFGAGTGLGLAISREIVERHGGTLNAESSQGIGSTFTVHLRVTPPPAEPAEEQRP